MIRKAVIVVLLLGAALTARFWVNMRTIFRASPYIADIVSFGVPGLSNVSLTDDLWLPKVDTSVNPARLIVPFWMVVAGLLAYPAHTLIHGSLRYLRRWRRRKRGECANCGYNLTGNVTGVCSECGVRIKSP